MKNRSSWLLALFMLAFCVSIFGCGDSSDAPVNSPASTPIPSPTPTPSPTPLPQQAVAPMISAVAIGVPDLTAATDFYRDVVGLEVLEAADQPDYLDTEEMDEVMLMTLQADRRNTTLVLMNDPGVTDPAHYQGNPDKIVFIVPDAVAFYEAIMEGGGGLVGDEGTPPSEVEGYPPGVLIGLAYDPNGYLIEMLQFPPALLNGFVVTAPYIVGVGVGVSSLPESREFYTRMLGFEWSSDLDVPGFMDEVELQAPSRARPNLVLMNYEEEKDYEDNPVKLVFTVDDAQGYIDFLQAQAPDAVVSPVTTYGSGAIGGYIQDLDGTLIQVVQMPSQQ